MIRGKARFHITVSTVLIVAALALAPSPAAAQSTTYQIRDMSLSRALREFGRISGRQIIFTEDLVRGRRAPELRGTFTPEAALRRLLDGSGLRSETTPTGAIMILGASPSSGEGGPRGASPDSREAVSSVEAAGGGEPVAAITVTGTRIRGGQSASPTFTFDRDDFAAAGVGSTQEMLRTLPQNFTGGSSETSAALSSGRNGNNNNVALGASVNLRGLGTESTLVLLNGRRTAPGGYGDIVDLSTIPLSSIERIEVVPDGASAIYGSDAVGGVVNFILRRDFEGAETRVRYGSVTDGGLRQFNASQALGLAWTGGSAMLNLDYSRNQPLLASERPFSIGLQQGVTYLSADDERYGILFSAHQQLTPNLSASALFYWNDRSTRALTYSVPLRRQTIYRGDTEQWGGTVSLDWRIADWQVTLAHTLSQGDNLRRNFQGATPTLPAATTAVVANHDVGATELEVEGPLLTLPAGAVRLAAGLERRTEELLLRRVDRSIRATRDREVRAGYAELFVPLVGETNSVPGVHRLNLTAAARLEDYDDVGTADTYKLSGLWSPVEHVNVRATYGTSFRAPYLYQYDASLSAGVLINLPGPTGLTRTLVIAQLPDPDLGPENATTWTAGLDIGQALFGLRISATYYSIDYQDRIRAARFAAAVLTDPTLAALVRRPPDPELIALVTQLTQFVNATTGGLDTAQASFDGRTRNQSSVKVDGVDLQVSRTFDTRLGQFGVDLNASYMLHHRVRLTSTAPAVDIVDTIYNPVDLRVRGSLSWRSGPWSAAAFVNYTDDYLDRQLPAQPVKVDSWTTVDASLAYAFENGPALMSGLTIRLSATNLFDADPPSIVDRGAPFGDPGFDTENANPFGRIVAIEVTKRW